ncbi:penicillin-binding protein activator [Pseudomaricurvus sp. HS19]|uniref:penicillin-binding protein activator n=1 Tax=Pseudomaricurvus sp. HS19 TaxID=2692626 RepID=UPI00136C2BA8|nr:penicillin-binding protein activator [Pseudomaricurvus sp. HS19]MYM64676.1 ABC transporter substrate-binding protein [Pseudomaricurvus sp. HS19]
MTLLRKSGRLAAAGLIGLVLYGCSSPQPTDNSSGQAQHFTQAEIRQMLTQAQSAASPQREHFLLQAAAAMHANGELHKAHNLLTPLDPDQLSNDDFVLYTLIYSDTALAEQSYFLAQRILTNPRLNQQWQRLPAEQEIPLRERRATLFSTLGETAASIQERLLLQSLLQDPEMLRANQEALWQSLMTMDEAEIDLRRKQAKQTAKNELQGWYELAAISKHNPSDLQQQLQQVNRWIARWPEHPASFNLPADLQLLQQLVNEQPRQVALLLPQQGSLARAGRAVRDGFMAAYFNARQNGARVPDVRFYDSAKGDIYSQYNRAVADGAELIIGPLDKQMVNLLSQQKDLPVPTLAVNYSDQSAETTDNLFQFGLSTEDEASQTAQRAWIEGHRYALILTNDSSWSTRSADAFRNAWEALGGKVLNRSSFAGSGDYSNVIRSALQIDNSQKRARDLRAQIGRSFEFEPRRRQDADFLYLVATPDQARQVKPTLAFHYASDLPVYASSHIYTGSNDPKLDRDMDGIRFSTLPWFFDSEDAVRKSILREAGSSGSFEKLYALGADSFQIYPRLKQLQVTPYLRLHGLTGALSMNDKGLIEREQVWATMKGGSARSLPRVVSDSQPGS